MEETFRNKKICFVVTIPDFARSFLMNYLIELSKENKVFLLSCFGNIESERIVFKDVTLVHIPIVRTISPLIDFIVLFRIYLFFRKYQFDIVHSGTPKAGFLAMVAARLARVPLRFHTFTGQVWVTKRGIYRWLLRMADKVIFQCSSDVIVDSHSQRNLLISEEIIDEANSYVLAKGSICGVDTNLFKPNEEQKIATRNRLHIPFDAFVFIFLGRITKDKGIQELLLAFDRISTEHTDAYLLLVGPDDEQIIKKSNKGLFIKNNRILYEDFTKEPEIFMSAADVMCLPSHREGFGMVIIEAAAAGIPTIGSRITGIVDAIEDGVTGLFHGKGDVDALYACMSQCISDRQITKRLGNQSRERILRDFSSQRLTEEFIKYYKIKLDQIMPIIPTC